MECTTIKIIRNHVHRLCNANEWLLTDFTYTFALSKAAARRQPAATDEIRQQQNAHDAMAACAEAGNAVPFALSHCQ